MADRIVQRISLEGAEDVQAKLKKTGEIGAKALAATNRTIEDSNSGLGKYGDVFASLNGKTEGSRATIERVKQLVETLKPAAAKAGIELDGIGEFGKLSRTNIIAMGAAITGTLVAAMEKAGDVAKDQAQRLGAFTGSASKGVDAYRELQQVSKELKVPTASLTSPFEQIARANQKSGNQLSGDEQRKALKSLFTGAEADRLDEEKSGPAISTFLGGLREQGQLSDTLLKPLSDVMPTLAKRMLEDLQKRLPEGKSAYTTPEVLRSLGNALPQLEGDKATTEATFGGRIDSSLTRVKAGAGSIGDALNGGQVVSSTLNLLADFLFATGRGVENVKQKATEARPPTLADQIARRASGRLLGQRQQVDKVQGGEGDQAVADRAPPPSPSKTAEQLSDADKRLQVDKQLSVIASKLAEQQARIDYQAKPEETDIQIGRDKLAVQNAAITKQSAQIGVQDAAKGKEIANLAPEQAENASRAAESRYTKALKNLRQLQGYDTDAIQDNPLKDARNELRDADTARKVADVNRRYAYLEPQKAELAQQKAQTDLTSADYLQQDSSLKLAKDQQGRQLSTDVAGLRYAQAQLEVENKINQGTDASVSLLDKILATLQGDKSRKEDSREDRTGKSGEGRTGRLGDASETAGPSGSTSGSGSVRDLVGPDGVVNIPRGASQEEISSAISKTPPQPAPVTKEGFRADLDQSIDDLKADWKSQRELNAQLHNQGTDASPQARTPAGVSQVNPPPVLGHYDKNYQFVPDVPTYNALGAGASIPATNDYRFSGRKNPAGPYQEGISAPVTFPKYNRDQLQSLPSEYPNGVPLPQPRPPEAGQQSSLPSTQEVASLGDAFRSLIEGISASLELWLILGDAA